MNSTSCVGLVVTLIGFVVLALAARGFLDTNMLVNAGVEGLDQRVGVLNQCVGCLDQHEAPP